MIYRFISLVVECDSMDIYPEIVFFLLVSNEIRTILLGARNHMKYDLFVLLGSSVIIAAR